MINYLLNHDGILYEICKYLPHNSTINFHIAFNKSMISGTPKNEPKHSVP